MRGLLFVLISTILVSCNAQQVEIGAQDNSSVVLDSTQIDSTALGIVFEPTGTYNAAKLKVQNGKKTTSSGKDFENYLVNDIIPHWYGTEWDFNGHTSVPNQGVIACGYFVSTTLLHMGVNVDRYEMAQQAGLHEAQTVALSDDKYRTIYGIDTLAAVLKRDYSDGIYFVGLDNHVGYLYIKYQVPYFIHSNYIEDKVMIEKAMYAPAFKSGVYVIAELSTNEAFLQRWRTGSLVTVIRPK